MRSTRPLPWNDLAAARSSTSTAPRPWRTSVLIPCPWCGDREDVEFKYGGAAQITYPQDPDTIDDATWARYIFFRPNPKGRMAERWVHSAGCRRWFTLIRDTVTHEITPSADPGGQ
ncbi:MAG: sarcosine oxidase subunit delta [Chloroflexi bacterium]|nr:MAG: sarcosine oxidase subunit delta [Chloroflexota bacterium]